MKSSNTQLMFNPQTYDFYIYNTVNSKEPQAHRHIVIKYTYNLSIAMYIKKSHAEN